MAAPDVAADVGGARRAARHVRAYAAVSFAFGWVVVVASLVAWALGQVPFFDAIDVLLAIGFGGVLSGVAMYATSWNLHLGATRLEVAAAAKEPPPGRSGESP